MGLWSYRLSARRSEVGDQKSEMEVSSRSFRKETHDSNHLHADDSPTFGRRFIPRLVEFADMRLSIVGPFTLGIVVMHDEAEPRTLSRCRPFEHLRSPSEFPNAVSNRRPMCLWIPTGLPALSSMKFTSGSFSKTGLPSRISNFNLPLLPTTCSGECHKPSPSPDA